MKWKTQISTDDNIGRPMRPARVSASVPRLSSPCSPCTLWFNRVLNGLARWRVVVLGVAVVVFVACLVSVYSLVRQSLSAQVHTDPDVVTAWVVGVTYGSRHVLPAATPLQRWLYARGQAAPESASVVQGRFQDNPGSLEVWFGYRSHLAGQALLECHRVGPAAFVDDRGQTYQGLLDFEGPYVGVYLPGYDHAARRLTTALHWIPRAPSAPVSLSRPMVFTLDLPVLPRVLPPAATLPGKSAVIIRQSVRVTASQAHLDGPRSGSPRTLTFHLNIRGGRLWASNVEALGEGEKAKGQRPKARGQRPKGTEEKKREKGKAKDTNGKTKDSGQQTKTRTIPNPQSTIGNRQSQIGNRLSPIDLASVFPPAPFVIEDPYGVSLLSPDALITPMLSLEAARCIRDGGGQVWMAPLLGAGSGTDAIHLHFTVLPDAPADKQIAPIPIEIFLPVESGSEV